MFRYDGAIFRYMVKILTLQSVCKLEFLVHYAKATCCKIVINWLVSQINILFLVSIYWIDVIFKRKTSVEVSQKCAWTFAQTHTLLTVTVTQFSENLTIFCFSKSNKIKPLALGSDLKNIYILFCFCLCFCRITDGFFDDRFGWICCSLG